MAPSRFTKFKKKKKQIRKRSSKVKILKTISPYRDREHEISDSRKKKNIFNVNKSNSLITESSNPLQMLLTTFNGFTDNLKNKKVFHDKLMNINENLCKKGEPSIDTDTKNINSGPNLTISRDINYEDSKPIVSIESPNNVHKTDISMNVNNLDSISKNVDPFHEHFNYNLNIHAYKALLNNLCKVKSCSMYWPCLHNITVEIPLIQENISETDIKNSVFEIYDKFAVEAEVPNLIKNLDWSKLYLKSQIQKNIKKASELFRMNDLEELTPFQKELFSILNNYQDFIYCERNLEKGKEIQFVYCLHIANHILKTQSRILNHNEKLLKKTNELVPDDYRDQGLVRPKVLILVPFKESCFRIVNMIAALVIEENKGNVINKARFMEEFSGSEINIPKINSKPEDYEQLFKGNVDDNFKIGIHFTKKSLKLFSDFYSSDIIIASPLGLRMVIGSHGDKERDFDFLASLEILILDQAEIFLMQNWDHLLLVFECLNIQPKESHGCDFSRIRSWALNGWSKFYRQTLIFSSILSPDLNCLFNRHCCNYAGKVRVSNPVDSGSISLVVVQLPHVFQRFIADSVVGVYDKRFEFFTERVLPQYKEPGLNGILIYVPSYFDFVRIRNYLKREDYSFVQICEYSKDAKIARARDKFFHNEARFLLYSERFHFFRRIKLKGIRHMIFYQLPSFPHFYPEFCNLMKEENQNPKLISDCNSSVTSLYCRYDVHQLSAIVTTSRAAKMMSSDKTVYMFTTG